MTAIASAGEWSYCEGFAHVAKWDVIFEHAWLVDPDGQVPESTWPSVEGCKYLGITFPADEVLEAMRTEPGEKTRPKLSWIRKPEGAKPCGCRCITRSEARAILSSKSDGPEGSEPRERELHIG